MDQNIKNRLVGVIVIFALAVIFLPMILDGSGVRRDEHEVVIPPQPLVSANPEFEQKMIELQAKVDALPDLESRFIDEKSGEAKIERSPVADDKPATESAVETVVEPEPEVQAKATVTQPQAETQDRSGGDSWVLQVGSFQDRGKALAQRDKLRKSNIAAVFIEQFKGTDKSSYRVRLGPFLNRDQTRVAQNKIKAKHDIDGIIMKYER
ncbi:MAG: SPOR domain-containing protein [Gammaproteobacteria bacterium]|nr:SPOR domain-containing protein [Gammaproteobacteria bacterium]